MNKTALIIHGVIAVALIAAYVVLTVTGHDGTVILGLLGGQGIGAGIHTVFGTEVNSATPPTPPVISTPRGLNK